MFYKNGKIKCCLNCEKRYLGCHSKCQDYNLEKVKIEGISNKIQDVKKRNNTFISGTVNGRTRKRREF